MTGINEVAKEIHENARALYEVRANDLMRLVCTALESQCAFCMHADNLREIRTAVSALKIPPGRNRGIPAMSAQKKRLRRTTTKDANQNNCLYLTTCPAACQGGQTHVSK